jgi:hypothetical protein
MTYLISSSIWPDGRVFPVQHIVREEDLSHVLFNTTPFYFREAPWLEVEL